MVVGDIATGTELLVIGAGPGGYVAAIRAAQHALDARWSRRSVRGRLSQSWLYPLEGPDTRFETGIRGGPGGVTTRCTQTQQSRSTR